MTDYIKREDAIESFDDPAVERNYGDVCPESVIRVIEDIPAADVRENVHGEWINTDRCHVRCSNCKHEYHDSIIGVALFCPRCGAIMNGGI